jgi:hypothetical protein
MLIVLKPAEKTIQSTESRIMSDKINANPEPNQSLIYRIKIKGHLGSQWTDWFEGMTITAKDDGETLITGSVADQAALYGLLKKVRDLGIPLVSVSPVEPETPATDQANQSNVK